MLLFIIATFIFGLQSSSLNLNCITVITNCKLFYLTLLIVFRGTLLTKSFFHCELYSQHACLLNKEYMQEYTKKS